MTVDLSSSPSKSSHVCESIRIVCKTQSFCVPILSSTTYPQKSQFVGSPSICISKSDARRSSLPAHVELSKHAVSIKKQILCELCGETGGISPGRVDQEQHGLNLISDAPFRFLSFDLGVPSLGKDLGVASRFPGGIKSFLVLVVAAYINLLRRKKISFT